MFRSPLRRLQVYDTLGYDATGNRLNGVASWSHMTQAPEPLVTPLTRRVGIRYPIIQDGMGGGALGTGRLAAAVSEAGALGSLSVPGITNMADLERAMRAQIDLALSLTRAPLAVNCPVGVDSQGKVQPGTAAVLDIVIAARRNDSAAERQLRLMTTSAGFAGDFGRQIRDAGMIHQHKVGAPHHAEKAEKAGADFVIASGYEMGGHTLNVPITTMVLAPEVIERVRIPVIISGGLKDGRGLAAALAMGAAGIAMGTRFLVSRENDWHERYIDRVIAMQIEESVVTPGLYGPCRMIRSKATAELDRIIAAKEMGGDELNAWKERMSHIAQRDGDIENGFTTCGMVAGYINDRPPVAEIIARIMTQAHRQLAALRALSPAAS